MTPPPPWHLLPLLLLTIFLDTAADENVSWRLLATQAWLESSWNPDATGDDGLSNGLAAMKAPAFNDVMYDANYHDITDPSVAVLAQARYINHLRRWLEANHNIPHHHSLRWALVAYNWGQARVIRALGPHDNYSAAWPNLPAKVRRYATFIIAHSGHKPRPHPRYHPRQ